MELSLTAYDKPLDYIAIVFLSQLLTRSCVSGYHFYKLLAQIFNFHSSTLAKQGCLQVKMIYKLSETHLLQTKMIALVSPLSILSQDNSVLSILSYKLKTLSQIRFDSPFFYPVNNSFIASSASEYLVKDTLKPSNGCISTFVDMDGDCLSDTFSLCGNRVSIQIDNSTTNYTFPFSTNYISFADMDSSGSVDLVFASNSNIYVAYNNNLPLCSEAGYPCMDPNNLCVRNSNFGFDFSKQILAINVQQLYPGQSIMTSNPFNNSQPIPIQLGDYNNDGYPDILFITANSPSQPSSSSIRLLISAPCTLQICGSDATNAKMRTFVPSGDIPSQGSTGASMVTNAAFLDIDNNGSLDVLFTVRVYDGTFKTSYFINPSTMDSFFLKTTILSGTAYPSTIPFYQEVSSAGANIKFAFYDSLGNLKISQIPLIPHTPFNPLRPPHLHIGLGRSTTYIQSLFVGIAPYDPSYSHFISYQNIIPNSHLIINPFQSSPPSAWSIQLVLNPSSSSFAILAVLISTIILLSTIIFFLDYLEKVGFHRALIVIVRSYLNYAFC